MFSVPYVEREIDAGIWSGRLLKIIPGCVTFDFITTEDNGSMRGCGWRS